MKARMLSLYKSASSRHSHNERYPRRGSIILKMSAALKTVLIVAALLALVSCEAPAVKEKEKRGSDKEAVTSQTYQPQQQKHRLVQQPLVQPLAGQHNFQYIQTQPAQQKQPTVSPYAQQQLQYVFREAPGQKQGTAVATQYVQPQFQYVYPQAAADSKAIAGAQYVQTQAALPHAALPQAYLGGQYYLHPGHASVLGTQYTTHPGASFYAAPQQHVFQQYYTPQLHPAFYYGGLPANYHAYAGNQQPYPVQQLLSYGGKAAGVEARGAETVTYLQPFGGTVAHQLPQNQGLASSEGVVDGQVSAAQAQNSGGKYSSKSGSEG